MTVCKNFLALLILASVTNIPMVRPEPHLQDSWNHRPSISSSLQQSVLLNNLDARLRSLEGLRHSLVRTESSIIDSISSRLELMESKITRLHTTFQHKFDTLTQEVERLASKYEIGQERENDKLSTLHVRVEVGFNKIHNDIKENHGRFEFKQNQLSADILGMKKMFEDMKSKIVNWEGNTNQTMTSLIGNVQEVKQGMWRKDDLNNLTYLLGSGLQERMSGSQNDQPNSNLQSNTEGLAQIVREEAHKIGAKMINMYSDVWKSLREMETTIRSSLAETNHTNEELREDLKLIIREQRDIDGFFDMVMDGFDTILQREMSQLTLHNRQTGSTLQSLIASQELHGETCHQLKAVIESKIAIILEKIYDTFINRTDRYSKQILEVAELIKSQNSHLKSMNNQTKRMIQTLAEEGSLDHKQLDASITEVLEKSEDMSSAVQDLQEQLEEINETFSKSHQVYFTLGAEVLNTLSALYTNQTWRNNNELGLAKNISDHKNDVKNLSVIEANFSNGTINIISNETNRKINDNYNEIVSLNKSINVGALAAIIGEPLEKGNETSTESLIPISESDRRSEAREKTIHHEEMKNTDTTQLLLTYIKLLKGHLTPSEFLEEAVPGIKYGSFQEMAAALKSMHNFPRETLEEIEAYGNEEEEEGDEDTKETLGGIIRKLYHHTSEESEEIYDETEMPNNHE